jgi:putative transposase
MKENRHQHTLEVMCAALQVTRNGYHAWNNRCESERDRHHAILNKHIEQIFKKSKGRYGHRFIYEHLRDEGLDCGRDLTLKLMKRLGIAGDQSPSYRPFSTNSCHDFGYSDNLVSKHATLKHMDEVWVVDTTYILTEEGWVYLATMMDLYRRRILGWSVSAKNDTELVMVALQSAILFRGVIRSGIIHHSDRGSTYASSRYQQLLKAYGFESSMSGKGNCYDNAAMESFFGRMKTSQIQDSVYVDLNHARSIVFEYI